MTNSINNATSSNFGDSFVKNDKLKKLESILKGYGKIALAFSGGVDSTFLLCFGKKILGEENVLAITATSVNFAADEIEFARKYATELQIRHVVLPIDLSKTTFYSNPPDRCYHCKKYIFSGLLDKLSSPEFENFTLCDGTNADDAHDYRPGRKALAELRIQSPLEQSGLTKEEIREASRSLSIPIWDKPAFACLASRIPYGETITEAKLLAVYELEQLLRAAGFRQSRVRCHGNLEKTPAAKSHAIARIEVPVDEIQNLAGNRELCQKLNAKAVAHSFDFCTIDIMGYRMGSLNEALNRN